MPPSWLQIRVDLLEGMGEEVDAPPGRIFAVPPATTFARLAEEINAAFGRWDVSHLHEFELADGRRLGFADEEDPEVLDHGARVSTHLSPGDRFSFVYDLGDQWRHEGTVLPDLLDPRELFVETPRRPVILLGWGWLPDQYGREAPDEDDEL